MRGNPRIPNAVIAREAPQALADTFAFQQNDTTDSFYNWLDHASDADITARFAAAQRYI